MASAFYYAVQHAKIWLFSLSYFTARPCPPTCSMQCKYGLMIKNGCPICKCRGKPDILFEFKRQTWSYTKTKETVPLIWFSTTWILFALLTLFFMRVCQREDGREENYHPPAPTKKTKLNKNGKRSAGQRLAANFFSE